MRANGREGISIRANDHEGISSRAKHKQGNMSVCEREPNVWRLRAVLAIAYSNQRTEVWGERTRPLIPSLMPRSPRCRRRACPTPRDL